MNAVTTRPRYKDVSEEKAEGATYTPENLANFVAKQIVSHLPSTPSGDRYQVLDPAVGEAALLVSLLQELRNRGIEDVDVYGFDTDDSALRTAERRLGKLFPSAKLYFARDNFLDFVERTASPIGNLFASEQSPKFDLIIANPPYVRTQVLGADIAQRMARQYGLAGRVDLYYAFILAMGWVLSDEGTAGIIVSNRFMTTKSGAPVRKAILESLRVKHIWDLGDTKLFDAAVLPAVLLAQQIKGDRPPGCPAFTSIYETESDAVTHAHDPIHALEHAGTVSTRDGRRFLVQHGKLNPEAQNGDVWRVATDSSDAWQSTVEAHTWAKFGDIGNIRVGIKTCADSVFISSDWARLPQEEQPELLLPLTTHHIARRFKPDTQRRTKQVLYPHAVINGQRQAVDLGQYPKAKAYLEGHREALSSRSYVTAAGREWYEIWVPQDPDSWSAPKLVFRDISERPTFWIDNEGTVVNGDCYWLTARSHADEHLLWLALAVSNSTFIEAFYDHTFNNKLYAGRRRFITQYVERFPLPDPNSAVAKQLVNLSKQIYELPPSAEALRLEQELDDLVWKAFGLSSVEEKVVR